MSPHNKKSKLTAQGPGIPYVPHKQPIKDLGKKTKVQKEARNILPTENVWDFYTKQRPISFQYYSRMLGYNFTPTVPFPNAVNSQLVDTLEESQSLVINHFAAYVSYRPDGTAGGPQENYRVALDDVGLASTRDTQFGFNLTSETGALYDANDATNTGFFPVGFIPTSGFVFLNRNVLDNGNSDTSLYIFESGDLFVNYRYVPTDPITSLPIPETSFFPGNFTGLEYRPWINFDIRGHLINRTDANLLRELILNRQ